MDDGREQVAAARAAAAPERRRGPAAPVAGVDGCRGGWVAAVWSAGGVEWRALPLAFADLLAGLADCGTVAVDVPIGLPASGYRRCDLDAKAALGAGRSSVFLVPPRPVLEAPDYVEACRTGRALHGKAISKQTWFIGGRILDATDTVAERRAAGDAAGRVVEAHPELSFLAMAGRPLRPKRSAPGLAERMVVLAEHFGDVPALVAAAPQAANPDDALDALACAWTARRAAAGTASVIGNSGMEIVT